MHLLNETFDKVVCINLLERPDKKQNIQEKLTSLGIEFEWYHPVKWGFASKVVNAVNKTNVGHFNSEQPNELGAMTSHYHVVKSSLVQGYNSVFVFEDDVMFQKDFNSKLEKYWKKLPKDWDFVSFYSFMYNILPENTRVSSRWVKSYKSWSLMAYGMNRRFMEGYVKFLDEFPTISDMASFKMQESGEFNCYSSVPTLCIPNTELGSNIRKNDNMNYEKNPTVLNMGFSNDNYW
jgi:GR25 family glycosyltransferase involved in LPS biosynthesis